jgi:O-acetyl-ADP-ribose deacetylase (regulator of RNase III)
VITGGGQLPARHVIHAVGPIWRGGTAGEAEQLASAYRRCLELAAQHGCDSVAFPSLSTGAYRYPIDQASRIALRTVIEHLQTHDQPQLVRFILFDAGAYGAYAAALEASGVVGNSNA